MKGPKFKLEIECTTKSFKDDMEAELYSILQEVARTILRRKRMSGDCLDTLGEKVGTYKLTGYTGPRGKAAAGSTPAAYD